MFPLPRPLGVVITMGLGVLALNYAGILRSLDGWLFDHLVEVAPSPALSSNGVLVVASERDLTEREILALARRLHDQGARASIFAHSGPDPLDVTSYHQLLKWKACVTWGAVGSGAAPRGIWRGTEPGWPIVLGADSPAAGPPEMATLLGLSDPETRARHYLDFRVKRDGFQRVEVERFLDGDLPRSLVQGKVVLVGRDGAPESLITTPVHRGREALSPLLLQAAIIDALNRDGLVRLASPSTQWMIALVSAVLLVLLLWRDKRASGLWMTVAALAFLVVAAWLALWMFQWWMPPAKALVLLGATGGFAVATRSGAQRQTLRRTLRSLAVDAQERTDKGRFLTSSSPWGLVEEMLAQSFSFRPSFLLRHADRSGRLEAVTEAARNACAHAFDPSTLNRHREPFATAARNQGTSLEDGLVVLPIADQRFLFGFWVFQSEDQAALEQARAYAKRLAAMFDRREKWRARARPYQLEGSDEAALRVRPLHNQLEGSIELLEGGRKVLAEVLDRSMEAVLAYDPFGALLHVSGRAVDLLGAAQVHFSRVAPADLLARITGADVAEVRRALRFVALRDENTAFKAIPDLAPGRDYFVHVRSLREAALGGLENGPGLPGIIVLIQDVTQTARAAVLKDEFMERIYFQLNNDFEAILAASALLHDPRINLEERAELLTVISEKIEEASGRMKETRSHFTTDFSPDAVERYPVRFEPVFSAVQAAVEADLESHLVTIEASISDYLQLVLAAPKPLEELLHALLLTLIHDSREESTITVRAAQQEHALVVTFANQGFGMPQEKLNRYLQDGAGSHETLGQIGAGLVTVAAWGGTLTVRSEVGSGMNFELTLASLI